MLNLNQPTLYTFTDTAQSVDVSVTVSGSRTSVTEILRLYPQRLIGLNLNEFAFDVAAFARKRFAIPPDDFRTYYAQNLPLVSDTMIISGSPVAVYHYPWHKVTVQVQHGSAILSYNFYNMPAGRKPTARFVGHTMADLSPFLLDRTQIPIGEDETPMLFSYLTSTLTPPPSHTLELIRTYRNAAGAVVLNQVFQLTKPPSGARAPIMVWPDPVFWSPVPQTAVTCSVQVVVVINGIRHALTNTLNFTRTCNADTGDATLYSEYNVAHPYLPTSQQTGRRLRLVWLNSFGCPDAHTFEVRRLSEFEARTLRKTGDTYNQPVTTKSELTTIYEARITATEADWTWMQWAGSGIGWVMQSLKNAHPANYAFPYMPVTTKWADRVQVVADGVEYTSARLLIELPTHKLPSA